MPVELAMRYGQPSIEQGILALAARPGIREILFMPQYLARMMPTSRRRSGQGRSTTYGSIRNWFR